jgi:peptidoglycan/LPS O-acetylase OafA/YrhL
MIRLSVFEPPLNRVFWFVGSLIVVYGCVYFVVRNGWQRGAFITSLVLLLAGFLLRRILYYGGVHTQFPYERLIFFLPFPFFMVGYYIRKHQSLFDRINDRIYYVVGIMGVALTLLEDWMCAWGHTLYFGTLLLVPAMVSFGGKQKEYTAKSWLWKFLSHIGAETGTYLYMLHMMIGNICAVIVPRFLGIDPQQKLYLWAFPVLVCAASVICGETIYAMKRVLIKKR